MPDRILRADFGEDEKELQLSFAAMGAYTFAERALEQFGCCKDNRAIIRAKAFPGRSRPTQLEIDRAIDEYIALDLVERYQGPDGTWWLFFKRWFRDNRFRPGRKPVAPRPPCLAQVMTDDQWRSADPKKFEELTREGVELVSAASGGEARPAAASGGRRRLKGKESKGKESKGLPDKEPWPHFYDFDKYYRHCYGVGPRGHQTSRARGMVEQHGWPKVKEAMGVIGGDYAFRYVEKVLAGDWDRGKGKGGAPTRHHVDDR